jgi:ribonuclease BN (tRNA processing enzyme)
MSSAPFVAGHKLLYTTNHPGACFGYRVEHAGRSVVYATDTEPYACVDPSLVRFAKGADLLIYDAQYTVEEYEGKVGASRVGWGHSTDKAAVELAGASGVGQLVLFHHDPSRTDEQVEQMEARAKASFCASVAAKEGLLIDFGLSVKAA